MVKMNSKSLERKLSSTTKRHPTCAFCGKEFEGCIVVGNYHPECFEIKKEKENNPYLFAKVERLEREMMAMRSKKH